MNSLDIFDFLLSEIRIYCDFVAAKFEKWCENYFLLKPVWLFGKINIESTTVDTFRVHLSRRASWLAA
jgi:hypothetical protein